MTINVPAAISVAVLYLVVLGVGIYASWKNRTHKNDKYKEDEVMMVAKRDFGVVLGTLTLTATWIGGGYINGTSESVYDPTLGLVWTISPFSILISMLVNGRFIGARMRDGNYLTMLDPISNKVGKVMAALCFVPAFSGEVLYTASILAALGSTISVIVGVDMVSSIVFSAATSILYTLIGGLYSVAYTDVVQLICMFCGLYIALPFAFMNPAVGSIAETAHILNNSSAGWLGNLTPDMRIQWFDLMGDIPWQTYFQRILASSSVKVSSYMSYLSVLGFAILSLPPILIGAIASSTDWNQTTYGALSPAERNESALVLPIVLQHLTPTPISVIGLASISAAVMSSTDSSVLSCSTLFSRHVYKSLLRPKASEREMVWVIRGGTLLYGTLACVLAIKAKSIYGLFVLCTDFVFVILFPQLISALYLDVNTYGSFPAFVAGFFMRLGAGIEVLNMSPFIIYPGKERFPYRTFSMFLSFILMLLFSRIAKILFEKKIISSRYDFLGCNLANGGSCPLWATVVVVGLTVFTHWLVLWLVQLKHDNSNEVAESHLLYDMVCCFHAFVLDNLPQLLSTLTFTKMSKRCHENTTEYNEKRFRSSFSSKKLETGMKGFFVSFDRGKQRFCQSNTFKLLNHYGDILYGPEVSDIPESDSECSDVEASLKLEIDTVKNSVKNTKKRFSLIKTGCTNLIFIKTHKIVPSHLIAEIVKSISDCEDLKSAKIPIIRDVLRVHPVDFSCPARLSEIKSAAIKFLPGALKELLQNNPNVNKEFSVSCNRRFNSDLSSIQASEEIVEGLLQVDPSWKYNCRSTEVVLIVEIIKSFCGISVAYNYYNYKKYNIRELMNLKSKSKQTSDKTILNTKPFVEEKIKGNEQTALTVNVVQSTVQNSET